MGNVRSQIHTVCGAAAALTAAFLLAGTDTPDVRYQQGIVYATVDGKQLGLDLYIPANHVNPPLLIWIHGGGWYEGSREEVPILSFVNDGYAIASISYRLSTVARFPAQSDDTKAAIRFLRGHAADYGYDASRIALLGYSAGGLLAVLAGVTGDDQDFEGAIGNDLDQSSAVLAIVSYCGVADLTKMEEQSTLAGRYINAPAIERFLGGPESEQPELARRASPVFHVSAGDPPLYLVHGDRDDVVPIAQSEELASAYRAHGLDVHLEVIKGGDHEGKMFYDHERNALVRAFLDRHLRPHS